MDDGVKKGFFYLGIIAALFIFFYYILPILFKILGFALKAVFYVFIWAGVAFVVVLLVAHIMKIVRKEN
jgi:hypothetical protein